MPSPKRIGTRKLNQINAKAGTSIQNVGAYRRHTAHDRGDITWQQLTHCTVSTGEHATCKCVFDFLNSPDRRTSRADAAEEQPCGVYACKQAFPCGGIRLDGDLIREAECTASPRTTSVAARNDVLKRDLRNELQLKRETECIDAQRICAAAPLPERGTRDTRDIRSMYLTPYKTYGRIIQVKAERLARGRASAS